ncbi:MAG: hypothetical protein KatS3mg108_2831 [Isosphaeraceae bacterium]|nr:MAG: hypothetical protein KatS3mg108_2831 [Isosphaeraceae bacterium]
MNLLPLLVVSIVPAAADQPSAEDLAFFESKVRPILVERCYECHAVTAKTVRGGLLLDSRPTTLAGGDSGPAIEPGNPDDSLLIQAIRYDDPVLRMPPKGKLPDAEIATLVDWVKRGAPDPRIEAPSTAAPNAEKPVLSLEQARQHWAFQPLKDVEPPSVQNATWCRTPIDRFILAKLEAHQLSPAPEADRRTLLRRAAFDLVGLPPTPEQAAAFLENPAPDAFEHLVDRLLDNPGYGERWARHWLDLARWAESHGFEHDYDRPTAYTYRDFVIEALNRDLPYNTFVQWQLAGDELDPQNPLALAATGFLGAGTHSTQITKNQVEKERYDELDDMLATTGTAFLGLTLGCARCHDHKYDPISSRDYYRMLATFTTTVRTEVNLIPNEAEFEQARARHQRDQAFYQTQLDRFERDELPARLAAWESHRSGPNTPPRWVVLEPSKLESQAGASFTRLPDGSFFVEGPNADADVYTLTAACDLADITALRIEALADDRLPHHGPGRAANGNFALTQITLQAGPRFGIGMTVSPRLINAKATFEQTGFPASAAIDDDPRSGWAIDPQIGRDQAAVFEVGQVLRTDSGSTLTISLAFNNNAGHNLGRFRIAVTDAPRPVGLGDDAIPPDIRAILAVEPAARSPEQSAALLAWYRTIDLGWLALKQALDDHARAAPRPEGTKAMICSEGLPAIRLHSQGDDFLPVTHLLRRGDPNQKLEVVEQGFLPVLMTAPNAEKHWQIPPPQDGRTSYRRRALAAWITDTEHGAGGLLARVIVNRLWQHHFGRGLVATPLRLRHPGFPTQPPRTARLARPRADPRRLEAQAYPPPDHVERRLPTGFHTRPSVLRRRPREHPSEPPESPPPRGRANPRCHACRLRPARPPPGRPRLPRPQHAPPQHLLHHQTQPPDPHDDPLRRPRRTRPPPRSRNHHRRPSVSPASQQPHCPRVGRRLRSPGRPQPVRRPRHRTRLLAGADPLPPSTTNAPPPAPSSNPNATPTPTQTCPTPTNWPSPTSARSSCAPANSSSSTKSPHQPPNVPDNAP